MGQYKNSFRYRTFRYLATSLLCIAVLFSTVMVVSTDSISYTLYQTLSTTVSPLTGPGSGCAAMCCCNAQQ